VFRPEDLQSVDVREHIRQNQRLYFRGGVYRPLEAAALVALEALLSGASDVRVATSAGWVAVFANSDWLERLDKSVFERMLPFEPGGPNGYMSEIVLAGFAQSLATATPLGARVVKGDSLGPLAEPLTARARGTVR
jgi:hypothetical protein